MLISTKTRNQTTKNLKPVNENTTKNGNNSHKKSGNNENDNSTIKLIGVIVAGDKQNNNWIVPVFFPVIYDPWFFIYFTI